MYYVIVILTIGIAVTLKLLQSLLPPLKKTSALPLNGTDENASDEDLAQALKKTIHHDFSQTLVHHKAFIDSTASQDLSDASPAAINYMHSVRRLQAHAMRDPQQLKQSLLEDTQDALQPLFKGIYFYLSFHRSCIDFQLGQRELPLNIDLSPRQRQRLPAVLADALNQQEIIFSHLLSERHQSFKDTISDLRIEQRIWLNLSHARLTYMNLSALDLSWVNCNRTWFCFSNLDGALLNHCMLNQAQFTNASLVSTQIQGPMAINLSLDLSHATVDSYSFEFLKSLGVLNFSSVHFVGKFQGIDFSFCNLKSAHFERCDLSHCKFHQSLCSQTFFDDCLFEDASTDGMLFSAHGVMRKIECAIVDNLSLSSRNALKKANQLSVEYQALLQDIKSQGLTPEHLTEKQWLTFIKQTSHIRKIKFSSKLSNFEKLKLGFTIAKEIAPIIPGILRSIEWRQKPSKEEDEQSRASMRTDHQ